MADFVFVKNATVWWPVYVDVPADGGAIEQQSFELKFRRLKVPEAEAVASMSNLDFLLYVATDWRGVVDDGKPVPFTAATAAELLDQLSGMALAIFKAWTACMSATPETRLGNFEPSPAGGPAAAAPTADPTASPQP